MRKTILALAAVIFGAAHAEAACTSTICTGVYVSVMLSPSGNPQGDNRACFFFQVNGGLSWYAIPYSDPGAPYNIGRVRQQAAFAAPLTFAVWPNSTVCGYPIVDDFQ